MRIVGLRVLHLDFNTLGVYEKEIKMFCSVTNRTGNIRNKVNPRTKTLKNGVLVSYSCSWRKIL